MSFKKVLSIFLTLAMVIGLFSACAKEETKTETSTDSKEGTVSDSTASTSTDELSGTLKIWSFTNEVKTFATAFKEKHPNVTIEYTMVPMTDGDYQAKLQQALATGTDVPDVVVLEVAFLKQYIDSPFLSDLTHLKEKAAALETYDFTIEAATDSAGVTKGYAYQATPGALFYRRSLAEEYFGTSEPQEVQALLSDMKKFEEAAKVVKEKSGGNTYFVASAGDFTQTYFANRSQPWVVDDKLVIDPKIDEMWDVVKSFRENGYEAQSKQWQEGWFAGMNDTLTDSSGQAKKVFSYFLPTWGLPYVLMPNSKTETTNTSGDWACIPGPQAYQWGGSWISVPKDAANPKLGEAFVEFVALNEESLTNWATGVYTNEYLTKIDPSVGDLFQGPGDFVSSQLVVNKIKASFSNSESSAFIGGQNAYESFAEVAPTVNMKLIQGTDDAIQRAMNDPLESYANGELTKEEAMKVFKESVQTELPDIIVE